MTQTQHMIKKVTSSQQEVPQAIDAASDHKLMTSIQQEVSDAVNSTSDQKQVHSNLLQQQEISPTTQDVTSNKNEGLPVQQ